MKLFIIKINQSLLLAVDINNIDTIMKESSKIIEVEAVIPGIYAETIKECIYNTRQY